VSNVHQLRPGGDEDAGLEPLGRRRGARGIGAPMRAVFDALYEAGEPLDVDTLAERTFDRVDATAHYHARRVYVRNLQYKRRDNRRRRGTTSSAGQGFDVTPTVSLERAWRYLVARDVDLAAGRGVLIRTEGRRFAPNPAKPPRVESPGGRTVLYTREQALGLGALEQAIGDVQAMRPELNRLLGGLDAAELRQTVELAATAFAPRSGERTNPRVLRARLRWLLGRPTTDAGRAWLLMELVRRAYGSPPER
jgi:hypothetical protein